MQELINNKAVCMHSLPVSLRRFFPEKIYIVTYFELLETCSKLLYNKLTYSCLEL